MPRVRSVNAQEEIVIPSDVTVTINAREVTVKGKRGTLVRAFKHLSVEMSLGKNKKGENVFRVSVIALQKQCSSRMLDWTAAWLRKQDHARMLG